MKINMAHIGLKNPVRSQPTVSSPPASAPATANLYKLAGQWEGFLFKERRWKTYERYGRALSRFLAAFPGRKDINSFLRPEIIDWVNARLAEGASVATVRTELAAIRSFFQFAVDMQQAMINPARGIKVQQTRNVRKPPEAEPRSIPALTGAVP